MVTWTSNTFTFQSVKWRHSSVQHEAKLTLRLQPTQDIDFSTLCWYHHPSTPPTRCIFSCTFQLLFSHKFPQNSFSGMTLSSIDCPLQSFNNILNTAVSKPVWRIPLLCVQWKILDNGQMNYPKHVEFYSKNKFEKLMHLFGFYYEKDFKILTKEAWNNSDNISCQLWVCSVAYSGSVWIEIKFDQPVPRTITSLRQN